MATIGIMSYGNPSNLKLKNFNKITITTTNASSNSNSGILSDNSSNKLVINSNTIVKKIKDFGMIGSINNSAPVVMRKKQKLVPLSESNSENVLVAQGGNAPAPTSVQPPAKRMKISAKNAEPKAVGQLKIGIDASGGPGRKGLPAPQAVARRNARERNRVKQVNNGFAALRQHIPEEIAKTFEATGGSNRGPAKKLSKVETLRMAVEYIRGLEKLLGYEIPPVSPLSADDGCFTVIKDELGPSSPLTNDNFDTFEDSNGEDQDYSQITDNLPSITTLNGLQYIRIPGTNTYQLLTADIFGNEENFSPLIDANCYPNSDDIADDEIPVSMLAGIAPASTPSGMSPPTSTPPITSALSPVTTSSMLSPAAGGILLQQSMSGSRATSDPTAYMLPPQFQAINDAPHHDQRLARVKVEPTDIVYQLHESSQPQHQHLLDNSSPHLDGSGQGYYITTSSGESSNEEHTLYEGVVHLKKELTDVILDSSAAALSDESMMDAIDWWEANTPKSDGGSII